MRKSQFPFESIHSILKQLHYLLISFIIHLISFSVEKKCKSYVMRFSGNSFIQFFIAYVAMKIGAFFDYLSFSLCMLISMCLCVQVHATFQAFKQRDKAKKYCKCIDATTDEIYCGVR